jgi:hypothetical protein
MDGGQTATVCLMLCHIDKSKDLVTCLLIQVHLIQLAKNDKLTVPKGLHQVQAKVLD